MIISDTHTHLYLKEFDSDRDQVINNAIQPLTLAISKFIFYKIEILGNSLPLIVLWLIGAALFFTIYFNFLNLRGFKHAFHLLRGDYSRPENEGELTHFQALSTAVSGTVGIGNIVANNKHAGTKCHLFFNCSELTTDKMQAKRTDCRIFLDQTPLAHSIEYSCAAMTVYWRNYRSLSGLPNH